MTNAGIKPIMSIVFSVILVIIGLLMLPQVLEQTHIAAIHEYADEFGGVSAIIGLVPLLYSVGVLGIAGLLAFVGVRGIRGGG